MFFNPAPDYRAEVWFSHADEDAEDRLEEQLREFMQDSNMKVHGLVVYRVFDW